MLFFLLIKHNMHKNFVSIIYIGYVQHIYLQKALVTFPVTFCSICLFSLFFITFLFCFKWTIIYSTKAMLYRLKQHSKLKQKVGVSTILVPHTIHQHIKRHPIPHINSLLFNDKINFLLLVLTVFVVIIYNNKMQ